MWEIIKKRHIYFISFLIFISFGLSLMLVFTKEDIFLFVNRNNSLFLDYVFRYGTDLGKGNVYIILLIATLFMKYRYTLTVCVAAIMETILVQVPKKILFSDIVRPIRYFADFPDLHIVDNIHVHSHYSFPSGHTAVAFCVYTLLAIFINKKPLQIPFLFLALFVGYSRIYLAQHFFLDVYFGAIIGVFSALFSFWLININQFPFLADWGWLDDRPLVKK